MNEKKTRRRGHEIDRDLLLEAGLLEADLEGMSKGELAELVRMVTELVETGESKTAKAMVQADYKWEPVPMETFISDPYYLGDMTADLFPKWHTALVDIFDGDTPPCEVLLGGALGTGKTTVAALGMLYDLYRVGCLKNPHEFFGLMRGANIAFALYSVSKEQAADSAFGKMMTWIDGSPYFKERMPKIGKHTTKAKFQDSPTMVIVGSKTIHAIGKDVFSFCISEGTEVRTQHGLVPVEQLDPSKHQLQTPSGGSTFDYVKETGMKECVEVTSETGTFTVSVDHLILVDRVSFCEWVRAGDLVEGDDIVRLDDGVSRTYDLQDGITRANQNVQPMPQAKGAQ